MKTLLLFGSLLAVSFAVSPKLQGRISNGQTASPLDFPSSVGILISGTSDHTFCGGVLISTRFILTAAKCVSGTNTLTVVAGASDMTNIVEVIPVLNIPSHIIIHPNYSSFFNRDDLAIIQLSRPAILGNYVEIANLPRRYHIPFTFNGWNSTLVGWGNTGNRDNEPLPLQHLQFAHAEVISNFVCGLSHSFVRDGHICTGTDDGGPCDGDEGSPVYADVDGEKLVIGIHSFHFSGIRGCDRGRSAVNTRLTEYLEWIGANTDVEILNYTLKNRSSRHRVVICNGKVHRTSCRKMFKSVFILLLAAVTALAVSSPEQPEFNGFDAERRLPKTEELRGKFGIPPNGSTRISGGSVASPTTIPWAAGVLIHGGTSGHDFCSGVLISSRFVLTSANCVSGANTVTVALNASNMANIGTLIGVSNVLIHPNFSWLLGRDDIAILTLSRDAPNDSTIRPVLMPRRSDVGNSFNNWRATTAGWGNTGNRDNEPIPTQFLMFAIDSVTSNAACQLSYTWIRSTHICVNTNDGGPCNGDEGAPVTVQEAGRIFLIGIHSFHYSGLRGCDRGRSAVATRITEYLDWIAANSDVTIPA
ncbi:transmembrane protease serine 11D-like [Topomyia yanbarensis]|uniref:transmembrane protease serine 11D-like n=1 Tax=Topomyia yanbarensis TaxID=2498891 RepID=UPI00273BFE91|nr:transmembrane protease serine 11D-like [Topomyia yanbarensis]